jgi:poly-gamma-glutamate synthesis protein (capsule biosynthesis protein)
MPFEELEPRWKVLTVDGASPIHKDFDPGAYPLAVSFTLQPNPAIPSRPADEGSPVQSLLRTNRDPDKMTEVITTGVTALVRATAETMRRKGNTYPAQDIGAMLQAADITHVSNEIPFTPKCPLPDAWQKELVFCSKPEYIELLEAIGADVVELTGDHFGDWGAEAMNYTLDLYHQKGIDYYGGGYNFEDARAPLLIEHNGNRIAFIGCNSKGRGYATARENNPGAILCDLDWLSGEVSRLHSEGYLPIVTFQHIEYYTYVPQPKLIDDFHRVAAGAAIVQGSQAHQPHGMEFFNGAFIHYGLGNLFFDQYHMGLPTGQGFLDRHVFYDGRHLSTELIGIRFVDFARPRLMTPEERQELLSSVFDASLW